MFVCFPAAVTGASAVARKPFNVYAASWEPAARCALSFPLFLFSFDKNDALYVFVWKKISRQIEK